MLDRGGCSTCPLPPKASQLGTSDSTGIHYLDNVSDLDTNELVPGKVPPNAKFSDKLERIGSGAFYNCPLLRRIAIPLKDGMITDDNVFHGCENLERVDLIGEVHETVATLSLKNWRDDVNEEIGRINRVLPTTPAGRADSAGVGKKAREVRKWIRSVIHKMEYYKAEHRNLLS